MQAEEVGQRGLSWPCSPFEILNDLPAFPWQVDALECKASGLGEAEEEEEVYPGFYGEGVAGAEAPYEVEEVAAAGPGGEGEEVADDPGGEGEEGGAVDGEVAVVVFRYLAVLPNIVAGEGEVTNECHVHSFYNCVTAETL